MRGSSANRGGAQVRIRVSNRSGFRKKIPGNREVRPFQDVLDSAGSRHLAGDLTVTHLSSLEGADYLRRTSSIE